MQWTPEKIECMFDLIDKGYSTTLVARELGDGCTKNCVIGKYHRERRRRGLSIPAKPKLPTMSVARPFPKPAKAAKPRPAAFVARLATTRAARLEIVPKPVRTSTVGVLDVTGCKWPIGEDDKVIGRHTFCNYETAENASYCDEHQRENVAGYSAELIRKTIKSAIQANKPRAGLA